MALLIFAALKCRNDGCVEFEELSLPDAFSAEAMMPIRFDAERIICWNRVNQHCGITQIKPYFAVTTGRRGRVTNLESTARAHQLNIAQYRLTPNNWWVYLLAC